MREVDIYDFDRTVVPFDSGTRFAMFCTLHYPWVALFIPVVGIAALMGAAGLISWKAFKKICFSFMPLIPRKKAIQAFWDKNERYVFDWFRSRPRESVVISASPDFLLEEIQRRLGFEGLICTAHNPKTGAIIGENCRSEEKVSRFREQYGDAVRVCDVYSDSLRHDRPIFRLAQERCFQIVKGQKNEFRYKDKFEE